MLGEGERTTIYSEIKSTAGKMRVCKGAIKFRLLRGTIFAKHEILRSATRSEIYELRRM